MSLKFHFISSGRIISKKGHGVVNQELQSEVFLCFSVSVSVFLVFLHSLLNF
jgi:hypothetical protein